MHFREARGSDAIIVITVPFGSQGFRHAETEVKQNCRETLQSQLSVQDAPAGTLGRRITGDALPPDGSSALQYAAIVHGLAGIVSRDRGVSDRNRLILDAKRKGYDYLYLTDDQLPNPFDDEPGFWNGILREIGLPFSPATHGASVQQLSSFATSAQLATFVQSLVAPPLQQRDESLFDVDGHQQNEAVVDWTESADTDKVFTEPVSWLDVVAPSATF